MNKDDAAAVRNVVAVRNCDESRAAADARNAVVSNSVCPDIADTAEYVGGSADLVAKLAE